MATCSTTDHSFKQMPAPVNHLMKDFYFFPGLSEDAEEEMMDVTQAGFPNGDDQKDSAQPSGCGQCGPGGRGRKKGSKSETARYSTL